MSKGQASKSNVRYLPTPAEKRFERYTSTGHDITRALTNALVARELGALTSSRLPYPFDVQAERIVLGGMIWGAIRHELPPGVFFVTLHEELARSLEDTGPTRDAQQLCEALCARTRNMTQDVIDLVFELCACEFSRVELDHAAHRVACLYDARTLLDELERLSRLLRADATGVEEVRTVLRRLGAEA
jgi:replicative DNA helicase